MQGHWARGRVVAFPAGRQAETSRAMAPRVSAETLSANTQGYCITSIRVTQGSVPALPPSPGTSCAGITARRYPQPLLPRTHRPAPLTTRTRPLRPPPGPPSPLLPSQSPHLPRPPRRPARPPPGAATTMKHRCRNSDNDEALMPLYSGAAERQPPSGKQAPVAAATDLGILVSVGPAGRYRGLFSGPFHPVLTIQR